MDEIKEFSFVVCPDYSVFGDFLNYKQIDAMARSGEIGYVLSTYGIKTVVNFRATYEWAYELALEGIPENGVVAIRTLGAPSSVGLLSIDSAVKHIFIAKANRAN